MFSFRGVVDPKERLANELPGRSRERGGGAGLLIGERATGGADDNADTPDGVRGMGERMLGMDGLGRVNSGTGSDMPNGSGGTVGLSERVDALLLRTEFERERVGVGVGVNIGSGSLWTC